MKKISFLILISFLFTSCASILKKEKYQLYVYTNEREAKVKVNDSLYSLPAKVTVKRSKKDLNLTLFSDTAHVQYKVKSVPNPVFLYMNLTWVGLAPAAYAIDLTNPKRFYYGSTLFLNTNDTSRVLKPPVGRFLHRYFSQSYNSHKGDINLSFTNPHVNRFYFKPEGVGEKVNTNFLGASAGVEYFYKDNRYVSFSSYLSAGFPMALPFGVHPEEIRETLHSVHFNVTDNYRFNRFVIGYGLNYSLNRWTFVNETNARNRIEIDKMNKAFGITLNTYHHVSRYILVGVVYRPTFWKVHPRSEFEYEHLISFDIAFKVPVREK